MPTIRPACDGDMNAVATIYTHHVLHGTGTFETTPPSTEEMTTRRADVLAKGLPYLVLEDAGEIQGFAYCNWFKPRPAYRFSAEDSVYLAPNNSGKGLGRILLAELMTQAERAGVRKLIAVIGNSANAGSIGVHRSLGFNQVGVLSACGWKFGRWLDVVLMEKFIGAGDTSSPE
nr:GNAT family N-acetyltransferase [uncultured Albidiferax sp.]